MQTSLEPKTIWRISKVSEATGLQKSSLYNRMNPASPWYDPSFPRCFKLSASQARNAAVGWLACDVIAWIMSKKGD